jgi:lysosomal acid lipase/cholesteryl ester hydrolase
MALRQHELTNAVKQRQYNQVLTILTEDNYINAHLLSETECNMISLGRCSILHIAIMIHDYKMVHLLLNELIEKNDSTFRPLVIQLMQCRSKNSQQTPLSIAASTFYSRGDEECDVRETEQYRIIKLLLNTINHQIDDPQVVDNVLNAQDIYGSTPLLSAITNNTPIDVIRELVDLGCNLQQRDNSGKTVLHLATIQNNYELVRYILTSMEQKVTSDKDPLTLSLYDQDNNGYNALHFAACVGSSKIAERLITNPLNTSPERLLCAESKDGKIPYFLAVMEHHMDVAALLSDQMAVDLIEAINLQIDIAQKQKEQSEEYNVPLKDTKQVASENTDTTTATEATTTSDALSSSLTDSIGGYFGSWKDSLTTTISKAKRLSFASSSRNTTEQAEPKRIGELNKTTKKVAASYKTQLDLERDGILDYIRGIGFPAEKHHVLTEDGFVIQMHRIPHGKSLNLLGLPSSDLNQSSGNSPNKNRRKRPVVFLQHGVCNSSSTWVVTGEKQSLAFSLAMAGFDVWMGNNRGTQFGRTHIKYNESHAEYWKFSWDQMAKYDVPAQIDYILNLTEQPKLSYVGHSQGTAQLFAALSTNIPLQDKIDLFVALAPVATLKYQTSNIFKLLANMKSEVLVSMLGIGEIGKTQISRSLLPKFAETLVGSTGFNGLWSLLMDCDIDHTVLPILTQYEPSPTSTWNLTHWSQLVRSGTFHAYDYGEDENIKIYGQKFPPLYDLKKINIPVAVFYGELDYLANPKDVETFLLQELPNVVYALKVESFKHNDFVWGKHAWEKVYKHIIELLMLNRDKQVGNDETDLEQENKLQHVEDEEESQQLQFESD